MDISQSLKDAENSLRDFIASVLSQSLGADWIDKCGISADRITTWQERKITEGKRQRTGAVDERLIYYADFYDLGTILKKHWSGEFSTAFGDWKTFEVWLNELGKLRDPDAHRRELLPHQKHLVMGISGEIRASIVRYRSKKDTMNDFFPQIESIRDSLGNMWVPSLSRGPNNVHTGMTLRPGDSIEYVITASDPENLALQFGISIEHGTINWQHSNSFEITITEKHIAQSFAVSIFILSPRKYHACTYYDDCVEFYYQVLPPR